MIQRYTVLRAVRGIHTRDPFSGGVSAELAGAYGADAPEPRVDVADLGPKDIQSLGRDPEVVAIAPVMAVELVKPFPVSAEQAAPSAWGIEAVGADRSPFNGSGVVVAVLDTGIDASHPAFQGVTLVQEDFSGDGLGDRDGHGTHCAGTLFGRDVNGTRIGVARGVTRALIGKVLGDDGNGSSDAVFRGIQWALNGGAWVLSLSLNFNFTATVKQLVEEGFPVDFATSIALERYRGNLRMFDALMKLVRARAWFDGGAVVVAAAGNDSKRDVSPQYEIAAGIPAASEGVVSVGALAQGANGFTIADFSNTLPEISGPGVNVLSARAGGGLIAFNGTSQATPHVAGVAALWWQALQGASVPVKASNVVAKLLATARTQGLFNPGVDIADRGVGIVTAP
jgi:subtilisin family serine protease